MTSANAPSTYHSGELFCGEDEGVVEVIDIEDKVVLRLSLAAAEDLAAMLAHQAQKGREESANV